MNTTATNDVTEAVAAMRTEAASLHATTELYRSENATLRAENARLREALREAILQAGTVWVESNALRDSKAAGELGRKWRAILAELGE